LLIALSDLDFLNHILAGFFGKTNLFTQRRVLEGGCKVIRSINRPPELLSCHQPRDVKSIFLFRRRAFKILKCATARPDRLAFSTGMIFLDTLFQKC